MMAKVLGGVVLLAAAQGKSELLLFSGQKVEDHRGGLSARARWSPQTHAGKRG